MGDLIAGGAGEPCWAEQCVPPPGRTSCLCRADCKIKVRNLKGIVENRSSLGGGRVPFKGGGEAFSQAKRLPHALLSEPVWFSSDCVWCSLGEVFRNKPAAGDTPLRVLLGQGVQSLEVCLVLMRRPGANSANSAQVLQDA